MNQKEVLDKAINLVSQNELEEAIQLLVTTFVTKRKFHKRVISVKGRLYSIRQKSTDGTISSEQKFLEENAIRKSLIDIIENARNSDNELVLNKKKRNRYIIATIALSFIMFVLAVRELSLVPKNKIDAELSNRNKQGRNMGSDNLDSAFHKRNKDSIEDMKVFKKNSKAENNKYQKANSNEIVFKDPRIQEVWDQKYKCESKFETSLHISFNYTEEIEQNSLTGLYFFSGGKLNIIVNGKETILDEYKIEGTHKAGNPINLVKKEIAKNIQTIVVANMEDILKELNLCVKE